MRQILGVLSLLIGLLVFALLLKSQFAVKSAILTGPLDQSSNVSSPPSKPEPALGNQGQQMRQIQNLVRESAGASVQRSYRLNDE